ncbi:metalloregulator ArsR/SmtB family transcription factor [Rubinisphaera sp.]|uniref:ArsR/SmtB family transcription factor n=1 Tax=Rubinisphaera sp. TaxID=2024857 RepID=UPI000C0DDBD5|nr:metalloregulator ArsR/SmtB family transcription factor [Rubinisphaera sp.]MBV09558.1 transcriptional regulator [Rubinisphaera sp.]HCS51910.1 ArsR family transcriptional regulator [Planctomycetaceae bacterium]|tara:strand:- start:1280 stop:1606 length:327 start_codon:yes stop_codon:yes gene_type:complete
MTNLTDDTFQAEYCAERLKALSDPLRLKIVSLLRHGELTVTDISQFLETEIVTVSHHLKILKHSQFVTPRRQGRFIYYSLNKDLVQDSIETLNLGCCKIQIAEDEKET